MTSILIPKSVNYCPYFVFFPKYMLYINDIIIGVGGERSVKKWQSMTEGWGVVSQKVQNCMIYLKYSPILDNFYCI